MIKLSPAIAFLLLFCFSSASMSEEIRIGISQQAPENQNLKRPARGMTQEQVVSLFGEAESQTPAKGNPPISSWHYADFIVYFESDTVIHSVLKHQPKVDNTPE